ncbi:MAG: translocation/assembly module TamB domain-containing protein [Candidatus Acidiferrales bacterium]
MKLNRRRIMRSGVILVPAILLGLLAVCLAVINTAWFCGFLRGEIMEQVANSTGARMEIGSVAPHWSHLSIVLNDIVVQGTPSSPPGTTPEAALLQVKRLEVAVQFAPLIHGKLELRTMILDQPVVHLRIDSQGRSNLPVPPKPSTRREPDAIFGLAIHNCAVHAGEIYYNDAEIPLDAEVRGLKFQAGYSVLTGRYKGSLSYNQGRLTTGRLRPIEHAVQVEFTATRTNLEINHLNLTSGASRLALNARLTNYGDPTVDGSYQGRLFTRELAEILETDALPVGEVSLDGQIGYHPGASARQSWLAVASVEGRMRSDKLLLRTNLGVVEARDVSASYNLKDANLRATDIAAYILGGRVRADFAIAQIDSDRPSSRLNASLRGVSLTTLSDAFGPRDLRRVRLAGTTNAEVQASWSRSPKNSFDNLIAHARAVIAGPSEQQSVPAGVIPVNGALQADYDGPRNQVSFGHSYLQTSSTKVTIGGTLDSRRGANSNIDAVLTTADVHEVASLATLVQNALQPPGSTPREVPDVQGSGGLNAHITGSARDPKIQGQLSLANLGVNRTHWHSVFVNLDASSERVEVQNGKLAADPHAQITFAGSAGLQQWSLAASSPISLHAAVANISIADAEKAAGFNYPVSGVVSAKIAVSGTKANPEGSGTLTVANGSAWNETIRKLTINAEFRQGSILSTADLQIPAGTILANADYTLATQEYDAELHTEGLKLDDIAAIQRGPAVHGTLKVSARGQGTIQNPELEANLAVQQMLIHDYPVSSVSAQVAVAHEHANVALHLLIAQGTVEGKADVELTGQRDATASLDVKALPVAAVLANFSSVQSSNVKGQTEIHLTAQGPLQTPAQMQAHLEIPTLNLSYAGAEIALAHPLRADYRNDTVTLAPTQIQGTGMNLTLQGAVPLKGGAPSLTANGSVDLAAVQKFAPSVRSSGRVDIHLDSHGPSFDSGMRGELRVSDAVFTTETIPVGVEGLNAQINLSGTRADIAKFTATAGGGTVTAQGFVTYGKQTAFNLGVEARAVRIRYPAGLRSILSGRINLAGSPNDSNLTGRVLVDRLSFTQAFDLSTFASQFSEDSTSSTPSKFMRNMKMNVSVQSADDLNLSNSKVSMAGTASLNMTGTAADPVLLGRIALTSGDVFFLGKRFEVQSGTIEFANPVRTNPVLSLYVKTTIEQYDITLNLSGPADRLRTTYTSQPALPQADIIHLLAFGNTNAESASTPTSSATSSAESVLAEGVTGQLAGKLENVTGISQLSIDPLATNSQGSNPGSQVAIQERVTGSLLLTISTDVNSTQNQLIELQYQLNKKTSVTVLRDQYGGYGIDVRLHKVF